MIKKISIIIIFVFISIIFSICIGNVFISPKEIITIFVYKIFSPNLIVSKINADIIFNIRLSRSILAFFVGASLSLTGVVMQSILRNPLASVYNLGISSGAGLGATLLIITGINFNQYFYSAISTLFAFITVIFILFIAGRIDKYMNNNSIILAGIVISLFLYSLMSFFIYIFPKYSNRIILWQLGNLYLKNFLSIFIIILIAIIFLLVLIRYSIVLDIIVSSFITAVLVSFVGIIGFVDLVSPHIVRKIFGAKHIIVVPMSALFGGILLNVADIFSRIIVQGANIPIGIVTALIGAPFFLYIFINNKS